MENNQIEALLQIAINQALSEQQNSEPDALEHVLDAFVSVCRKMDIEDQFIEMVMSAVMDGLSVDSR